MARKQIRFPFWTASISQEKLGPCLTCAGQLHSHTFLFGGKMFLTITIDERGDSVTCVKEEEESAEMPFDICCQHSNNFIHFHGPKNVPSYPCPQFSNPYQMSLSTQKILTPHHQTPLKGPSCNKKTVWSVTQTHSNISKTNP